jgi:RNA polymerase sigma-70 factor, ECF subfamily
VEQLEEERQLESWMNIYDRRLLRLAYAYVRDWSAAEDRVQDAFIKAYRSMDKLTNTENPFPWLAKIVINECKTSQKRKRWREVITGFLPEPSISSTEDTYLGKSDSEKLHDAILSLPEKYRTIIILYYFDELSIEQISEVFGAFQGTVKSRLARGRDRLRRFLKEDEQDESRPVNKIGKTLF